MEIFKKSNDFKDRGFLPALIPSQLSSLWTPKESHIAEKKEVLKTGQSSASLDGSLASTQSERRSIVSHSDAHLCLIL